MREDSQSTYTLQQSSQWLLKAAYGFLLEAGASIVHQLLIRSLELTLVNGRRWTSWGRLVSLSLTNLFVVRCVRCVWEGLS
jgi:hypothetical protein